MTDTNVAKKSIYIAPTPPADLIDSMSFTIDFAGHKFLQVGLDPLQNHAILILIITPARHILIPTEILQTIFNMMGDILYFLLNATSYKRKIIFFEY